MRIKYHLWFFSLVLLLCGCASLTPYGRFQEEAAKNYQSGNYDEAVRKCVASLRINPQYEKSLTLLIELASLTFERHLKLAQEAENKQDWDTQVAEYNIIVALSNETNSLPPLVMPQTNIPVKIVVPEVIKEQEKASQKAAEAHYHQGKIFSEQGNHKEAAKEFKKATQFVPDFKEAAALYEKERRLAMARVAVMPFENKTGQTGYGAIGEMVSDAVIELVMSKPQNMEFMELVSREKLKELLREQMLEKAGLVEDNLTSKLGKILGVNYFVFGKINFIAANYPPEKKEVKQERNSYKNNKTGEVTNYYATVSIYQRKGSATVKVSYQIIEAEKGTILKSKIVEVEAKEEFEFAKYTGDENALSDQSRELCNRPESYPKPEEQMVMEAAKNASSILTNEIVNFFE